MDTLKRILEQALYLMGLLESAHAGGEIKHADLSHAIAHAEVTVNSIKAEIKQAPERAAAIARNEAATVAATAAAEAASAAAVAAQVATDAQVAADDAAKLADTSSSSEEAAGGAA
jgi:hypothetical protein